MRRHKENIGRHTLLQCLVLFHISEPARLLLLCFSPIYCPPLHPSTPFWAHMLPAYLASQVDNLPPQKRRLLSASHHDTAQHLTFRGCAHECPLHISTRSFRTPPECVRMLISVCKQCAPVLNHDYSNFKATRRDNYPPGPKCLPIRHISFLHEVYRNLMATAASSISTLGNSSTTPSGMRGMCRPTIPIGQGSPRGLLGRRRMAIAVFLSFSCD